MTTPHRSQRTRCVDPRRRGTRTVVHHDPARTDPEASDASLRAALESERANADHLRDLSRQQAEVLRRPLVRVARALDRRTRRYADAAGLRYRRVRRRAARAALVTEAVPVRARLEERRTELDRARHDLADPPAATGRVSIIMVTDGPCWAPPLPDDLDHELIVVLTDRRARAPEGVDSLVIASHQTTAATAAMRGAARATGQALCFLAPTSEPLDSGWLSRLVGVLDDTTVAATPMLIHPERPLRQATPDDLRVRELGLDVVDDERIGPHMVARQAGTVPRPDRSPVDVAAGSAACLLVDRSAFTEAGGLAPIDDLDAAMVDLCGRLRAGGKRVLAVPSSLIVDHRPVASRRTLTVPIDPDSASWRTVVDRQGAALSQLARGDRLTEHLRLALTVAAPSARAASQWGDWHLGQAMARSLRRQGHSVRLQRADQANDPAGRSCDVHIVLRGKVAVERTPGQRHVLWIISHPESVETSECDAADLVLVASERYAQHLRTRTSTPVEVLLQATDHRRFRPRTPDPRHTHAVAVVAMTRHVFRPVVASAIEAGLRPAIYGGGWHEFVDDELIVAEFVRNEDLPVVYSSVGVLLNDHWDTMRAWGFVSNRLFDALACGTPVVSDHLPELEELFGDAVDAYTDAESLGRAVERALDDPIAARQRADAGRAEVLARHTFDHRASELLAAFARHGLDGGSNR